VAEHRLFDNPHLSVEADSRLSATVEHGLDPVRSSNLGCRYQLWHSAELEAVLSRWEEDLYLAGDLRGTHRGRRRDTDGDFASYGRMLEAASVEDQRPAVDVSMAHQLLGREGHANCRVAVHKALEAWDGCCRADQPRAVGNHLSKVLLTSRPWIAVEEVEVCDHGHFDRNVRRHQECDHRLVGRAALDDHS
jgi:hypothetical protein